MKGVESVVIVGVGLIGGSIGRALRERKLAERVIGVGRNPGRLAEAEALGAIDAGVTDLRAACRSASVVVVCTPVERIGRDVVAAAGVAGPNCLVTDAGSTKARVVAAAEADPAARSRFVGAHPLAGSERSGVAASRAELLDGCNCVLTPTDRTPADRLERAEAFWRSLGCRTRRLDPDAHDAALARTSHLPHLVASALASIVPPDLLGLAAGAYRDGTRVAAAEAALWSSIFRENRGPLLGAIDDFTGQLDRLRRAIEAEDWDELERLWERGRSTRQRFQSPESS